MAEDKQQLFSDLRQSTFSLFVIFVSLTAAVAFWLANLQVRTSPPEILVLWCGLQGVCALSWWLRKRYRQVAIYFFITGMWLCLAAVASFVGVQVFVSLFPLLVLASLSFAGYRTTFVLGMITSLFLLAVPDTERSIIVMIWVTILASFIAFRNLYEALDTAWRYEHYAVARMSEAREHRAALMQVNKVLNETRHDLERANAQFHYAYKAAEEARHLKAQFAANVSHELRTPINLIVGFSETMTISPQSYGEPLPPVYWADMNIIYRSAKHLQSLINDVLDVSQIEAGKMAIVKEEVDPRQVIIEAANVAHDLIVSKGLAFTIDVPTTIPLIYLDRTRIRQVILNLLSNAVRFTDRGSIVLSAILRPAELLITVKDSGIGIPREELKRVFEEFHQVEGSLSRKWGGSGLGLTLSKQFVELHGGTIWVESELGIGTTFTFTLPFRSISSLVELETHRSDDSTRYFVVLNDDPAILALFERHATQHRAIGVGSKAEALRLVNTIHPAALLVDIQKAHDLSGTGTTPIIASTMPIGRRNVQYGTATYVKPVTSETLRAALEPLAPATALIIGEDRDVIRMLSRLIMALPCRLLKAYSREEGMVLLRQSHPDVVITDILTPDADGLTLIEYIKTDPTVADIPVVVVSVSDDIDELTPAPEGRMVITQPSGFEPMQLIRCVEALIDAFDPKNAPAATVTATRSRP